jgi:hypothetical protein
VTDFTFSAEQIRSAPPEVRQWIQDQIASALLSIAKPPPETGEHSTALAVCTPEEAVQVFEIIRSDFVVAQVFLELALAAEVSSSNLYALDIDHILRRTRLTEGRLLDCFRIIGEAYQQVRHDPNTALFGFDQNNHIFIDAGTNHSIRSLWQQLATMRAPISSAKEIVSAIPNDFDPPRLGPSDSVAAHQRS